MSFSTRSARLVGRNLHGVGKVLADRHARANVDTPQPLPGRCYRTYLLMLATEHLNEQLHHQVVLIVREPAHRDLVRQVHWKCKPTCRSYWLFCFHVLWQRGSFVGKSWTLVPWRCADNLRQSKELLRMTEETTPKFFKTKQKFCSFCLFNFVNVMVLGRGRVFRINPQWTDEKWQLTSFQTSLLVILMSSAESLQHQQINLTLHSEIKTAKFPTWGLPLNWNINPKTRHTLNFLSCRLCYVRTQFGHSTLVPEISSWF